MATTPPGPDQPTTPAAGAGPGYTAPSAPSRGFTLDLARMPNPGNAEFVYVILAAIALFLLAWIADGITDRDWWVAFVALSVAYLISRGIAKASRVLEQ